jgi:putative ABC transport system substrate-binding protein
VILRSIEAAAQKSGVRVIPLYAHTPAELDDAFAAAVRERAGAAIFASDQFVVQQSPRMATLSLQHRLPSIVSVREFAEAGGLVSYGHDVSDLYRRAASYVDKVLKGANPAELPIEQPTKIQMVVNMKTAKALGLKVPDVIRLRADRVIE